MARTTRKGSVAVAHQFNSDITAGRHPRAGLAMLLTEGVRFSV
jgi:hypothetical protein